MRFPDFFSYRFIYKRKPEATQLNGRDYQTREPIGSAVFHFLDLFRRWKGPMFCTGIQWQGFMPLPI